VLSHLHQRDATGDVDLQSAEGVRGAIARVLCAAFDNPPTAALAPLDLAVTDLARAYRGDYPGLLSCDTPYHDLRHAFDSGLTMARLLAGHNARHGTNPALALDLRFCLLGIILALFHDIGFLRRPHETDIPGGALAAAHEERGVIFVSDYLAHGELADMAPLASLILATRLDHALSDALPRKDKALAAMLGTADLLSQLADRCYLEKCRDFLFAEFTAAGIANTPDTPYPTPEVLLAKTPDFYSKLLRTRLEKDFDSAYLLMDTYFGGGNPYHEAIQRNLDFLAAAIEAGDFSCLRRQPHSLIEVE
jgi:hypothetical protein